MCVEKSRVILNQPVLGLDLCNCPTLSALWHKYTKMICRQYNNHDNRLRSNILRESLRKKPKMPISCVLRLRNNHQSTVFCSIRPTSREESNKALTRALVLCQTASTLVSEATKPCTDTGQKLNETDTQTDMQSDWMDDIGRI